MVFERGYVVCVHYFALVYTRHCLLQILHSDWLLDRRDGERLGKMKTNLKKYGSKLTFRRGFRGIFREFDRVYTKTIRELALVVYERIVNSGFAFVDYSLIDNSDSLSNCQIMENLFVLGMVM